MEYLIAVTILVVVSLFISVYGFGYKKACRDFEAEADINKYQAGRIRIEWNILREYQARAGMNVRPTLSVVTPIKGVSK